jgi:hypothetical protein
MVFITAGILAIVPSAFGQLIVGNDQSGTATIWNVDPLTGIAAALYSSSTSDAKPWGMAYDQASNTLYWNNGSTLYKSAFGPALTPTNMGTMMFNAATVNFVGLGFKGGKLYGTRNIATEAVYEINTTTLQASQVYVYPSTYDFGGLDSDWTTDDLYGLSDTAPAPNVRGLYKFDLTGQSVSFVAPYPAGETDIDGLAVNAGLAYYVTDGPNTTQANFYVYDIASGTQVDTIPSPFTGSGTFSAAVWVPEPATAVLVLLGAAALIRRKR